MPPKAVEALAAQADKMHREMYPEQYGDQPKPTEPPAEPGDTPPAPPAEPPAPPAAEPPAEPPAAAQPEPPATPPADPNAPPSPPEPPATNWEERYNSLRGKYDAEVPRLFREIAELKQQLALTVAQATKATPTTATPPVDEIPEELKTKLAQFSEDYPDVAEGLQAMLQVETNKIRREAAQEIEKVRAEASVGVTQQLYSELDRRVPDWKVIRDDPTFASWLQNVDPFSGRTLADLAQVAQQEMDINRIVAFYEGYKQTKQAASPAPSPAAPVPSTPPPAAPPANNPAAPLVAPPRSHGSPPPNPTPTNNETITSSFIAKFYNDAAQGKYRGRDKEYAAIEAKIDKAINSGRVVQG